MHRKGHVAQFDRRLLSVTKAGEHTLSSMVSIGVYTASKTSSKLATADAEAGLASV